MHRKLYVLLLTACVLAAGCGTNNSSSSSENVSTKSSTSVESSVSTEASVSASVETPESSTEDTAKEQDTKASVTADIEYSTLYDTIKSWGEGKVKSVKPEKVIAILSKETDFLPSDGSRMMLSSSCNNYVKMHDSESDYSDTILIYNGEGIYTVNQLSTTAVTDSGNNSAQTTIHTQLTYTPSEDGKTYDCTGYKNTITGSESVITEEPATKKKLDTLLPSYTSILKDFVNHIDEDYIFDAEYQILKDSDAAVITVYQNIEGSDWGLVGNQYALSSSIYLGPKDQIQRITFSITAATNESYEYHKDNEYQVQMTIMYNFNEEGISDTLTTDLKAEKEKQDKKNSKNNKKTNKK